MTKSRTSNPVRVHVTNFEHPNAVRIEIVIHEGDADERNLVATAIEMALHSVLDVEEDADKDA